jgi:hypothetical protein
LALCGVFVISAISAWLNVNDVYPSWGTSLTPAAVAAAFCLSAVVAVLFYLRLRAFIQGGDRRLEWHSLAYAVGMFLVLYTGDVILLCPLGLIVSTWANGMLLGAGFVEVPCRVTSWDRGVTGCTVQATCTMPDGAKIRDRVTTGCAQQRGDGEVFTYPVRQGRLGVWLRDTGRLDPWPTMGSAPPGRSDREVLRP